MNFQILLPFQVFADEPDVSRMVVDTRHGSLGILPHRLDCVLALAPGILVYASPSGGETYVALDQGVLVKTGDRVRVSVRHAIRGDDLGALRDSVEKEFLTVDEHERAVRTVMAKLESGLLQRFSRLHHG